MTPRAVDRRYTQPLWSILVPTVPERAQLRQPLLDELYRQAHPYPDVEILVLEDNRRLPYGLKLQRLAGLADGTYLSFVDDDDWVAAWYVDSIIAALHQRRGVDAVTIAAEITTDGCNPQMVLFGAFYDVATMADGSYRRPIQHLCPVRADIVAKVPYGGHSGADTRWSTEVRRRGLIRTTCDPVWPSPTVAALPLYHYRARTGDPDLLWTGDALEPA